MDGWVCGWEEKWRLKLTSAKVKVEVEAELGATLRKLHFFPSGLAVDGELSSSAKALNWQGSVTITPPTCMLISSRAEAWHSSAISCFILFPPVSCILYGSIVDIYCQESKELNNKNLLCDNLISDFLYLPLLYSTGCRILAQYESCNKLGLSRAKLSSNWKWDFVLLHSRLVLSNWLIYLQCINWVDQLCFLCHQNKKPKGGPLAEKNIFFINCLQSFPKECQMGWFQEGLISKLCITFSPPTYN